MKIIGKIPNWLRWILFLPVAIVCSNITSKIYRLFSVLCWELLPLRNFIIKPVYFFMDNVLLGIAMGFVLVYMGAKIAPKGRFFVSIILLILLCIGSFQYIFIKPSSVPLIFRISQGIGALISGIGVCYDIHRKEILNNDD